MAISEQGGNPKGSGGGKGIVKGHMLGLSAGLLDAGIEYSFRRSEHPDESKLISGGIAATTAAAWYFFAPVMWAKTGAELAGAAGTALRQVRTASYEQQMSAGSANFGRGFQDTDMGYTSRQRGMQAIQNSRLNARSALGNEARSLHRF